MCRSANTCLCPKHNQDINKKPKTAESFRSQMSALLFYLLSLYFLTPFHHTAYLFYGQSCLAPVWYTLRYSSGELFHQSFVTGDATVGLLKVREGWACQAVRLSASPWFSKTSVNHKAFFPSGAATLLYLLPSRGAAHSCCCSDLIVQFRMTGFHLQLAPGSAHLIPSVRSFTW